MPTEQSEISRLEQANALGLEYLRTVVLLNGGAILALLTFLGNSKVDASVQFTLRSVKTALLAFLVGIVAVLVGLIVSYTYTATPLEYRYHQFWNRWIVTLNAVLAIVSLGAFVLGVSCLILGATAQ